jgi:hypothetical protein
MLDAGRTYNTIDHTMVLLHSEKKGQTLNTLERFHIYHLSKQTLKTNDIFQNLPNPIFDFIVRTDPHN